MKRLGCGRNDVRALQGITNMKRREFLASSLVSSFAAFAGAGAQAQTPYPNRPIRLIVPWAPGGVNDAAGRPWAEIVRPTLGAVTIDNIGGAGGVVGATAAARAAPDGYTLLLGGGATHVINPVAGKLQYDPVKDFAAVSILSISGVAIAVHPSIGITSLAGLIAYAKANRGKLTYGTPGVGSAAHLGGEMFKFLTDTQDIVHAPYRGGGPALNDLIGGQITIAALNVTGQILEMAKAGKIILLCISTPQRLKAAPDLPTGEEAGVKGFVAVNFAGIFAPAKTPRPVLDTIAEATRLAMADPEYLKILAASGFEPTPDITPERAAKFVDSEIARWTPVIQAIGFKLE